MDLQSEWALVSVIVHPKIDKHGKVLVSINCQRLVQVCVIKCVMDCKLSAVDRKLEQ